MNQAKKLTIKNFKIAEKFIENISQFCEGILLSGSNAWGAYYAITAKSDVDLFIAVDNIRNIEAIVKVYINNNLVESGESKRVQKFKELYKSNKASHFSIITDFSNTAVSIDFFLKQTVQEISSFMPMNIVRQEGINVRTTREFRKNKPRVTGYSLDNLAGGKQIIYHPKFKEVRDGKEVIGYISKTLIDGMTNKGGNSKYFLGVMAFFLCIEPVILFDRGFLKNLIYVLQKNIATIMGGRRPTYITRQDRMNKIHLNRVKEALFQHS